MKYYSLEMFAVNESDEAVLSRRRDSETHNAHAVTATAFTSAEYYATAYK